MALLESFVPTTELEAVNAMLADNGESPVENLTLPLPAHVETAVNIIKQATRGVQSRGWHFNTVRNTVLTRDSGAGFSIAVPSNTLRLRKTVNDDQRDFDFSYRHGYLWNNLTNSDSFDGDEYVNGVRVDITYALDFAKLPETARQLIVVMSARKYQEKTLGNADLSQFSQADQESALQNLIDAEGLLEDTNSLKNVIDQKKANEIFDTVSRECQFEGWHFNTRKEVFIEPDGDNHIVVPSNTLRCSKSDTKYQSINVAHRGEYLFDVANDTYEFDADDLTDGGVYLDVIEYLEWEELPPVFKRYVEIKVARQLQPQKQVGTAQGYTERDEFLARQALIDDQGLVDDNSLLDTPINYLSAYGRTSQFNNNFR